MFPTIRRSLESFIEDEEGNIPRNKLLAIGTVIVVMSLVFGSETLAAHGSHSSHSSHASHASTSYHRSHSSHSDHGSHASHGSHTSHSNTAIHSNSNYSAAGDYGTPLAPTAKSIAGVQSAPIVDSESLWKSTTSQEFATPVDSLPYKSIPALSIPLETPQLTIPNTELLIPLATPSTQELE